MSTNLKLWTLCAAAAAGVAGSTMDADADECYDCHKDFPDVCLTVPCHPPGPEYAFFGCHVVNDGYDSEGRPVVEVACLHVKKNDPDDPGPPGGVH